MTTTQSPHPLWVNNIRAITLDLDDTLWPVWPTIRRAEAALHGWLTTHAPSTAALLETPETMRGSRDSLIAEFPHLAHDFTFLRQEAIRRALIKGGDDPALAPTAFEAFFAARHDVELFDDTLAALQNLSARFPILAISNGNADIQRVGLARYFKGAISAAEFGVAKPDARIFKAAAAALGVDVAQVLHVGDDALLDVLGAQRAGMYAAWLSREGAPWPHQAAACEQQVVPSVIISSLHELCDML